jgi:F0F1-type ATP synthase assembly protein I
MKMGYYLVKLLISAAIIVIVSEVSKYNAAIGGLIKSLPLISIIALVWLYADTHDTAKVAELSISTFWFVLPTLPMFLIFPALLGKGLGFYISLAISIAAMLIFYGLTWAVLKWAGVQL